LRFEYCPKCGRRLVEKFSWDEGGVPYCSNDDMMFFDIPKPCIVVAVIREDEILLLKQSYIYKNSKVLLSGYVTNGENIEETVAREVKEETGIIVDSLKYLGSDCIPEKEILMITFMAKYVAGEITKSSEVEWAEWCKISDAISEMSEDKIGKSIVKKVIKEIERTSVSI
jgi:NAD+ diphosphatase